jgi:valyl-tRNA synthetase
MMMMGEHIIGELPFKHIYLHALVRDENGAKMSKSKGNVIDPLDMVEEFSADIVRFSLAYLTVQGRDIKLGRKHLELYRNFTNKLYNASNFLLMNESSFKDLKDMEIKSTLGKYMLSRLSVATDEVRDNLDNYRFNDAANAIYKFVWMEFCDWGIEYSKAEKSSVAELGAIFKETLKLVSPFMPFIADYLYHKLSGTTLEEGKSVMIMNYPKELPVDKASIEQFAVIEEAIVAIRRAKVIIDMGNSKIDLAYIKLGVDLDTNAIKPFIQKLAKVENIEFVTAKIDGKCITDVSTNLEVYIPTDSIDLSAIKDKLSKQKAKLEAEINKLSNMLNNEKFVANAPAQVLETNRTALSEAQSKFEKVEAELKSFE